MGCAARSIQAAETVLPCARGRDIAASWVGGMGMSVRDEAQPVQRKSSRRALRAGALGGLGAMAAAAVGVPTAARAADGRPAPTGRVELRGKRHHPDAHGHGPIWPRAQGGRVPLQRGRDQGVCDGRPRCGRNRHRGRHRRRRSIRYRDRRVWNVSAGPGHVGLQQAKHRAASPGASIPSASMRSVGADRASSAVEWSASKATARPRPVGA